jgi:hypothetical protein
MFNQCQRYQTWYVRVHLSCLCRHVSQCSGVAYEVYKLLGMRLVSCGLYASWFISMASSKQAVSLSIRWA